MRVGVNNILKFEHLVDNGYCLLGIGLDSTVHVPESEMEKINDFSGKGIIAENSLSNGTDVNSSDEECLTQRGDNNVNRSRIVLINPSEIIQKVTYNQH